MLSCSSTTTSSPSIVVRAYVGPLPVWSEKRRTTAREIAALTGPRPWPSSAVVAACEEVGMMPRFSLSLRGEDARGGEKRTEPGDDNPHSTAPRALDEPASTRREAAESPRRA